jgi:GNAT superfamily N-acetyltransferase
VIENDDLDIVAAAHISTEDSLTEFAFSVLADYQGQGMGDALMKRCIEYCQNKLIKRGFIVCMATNHKIKKLAAKNNITIKTEEGESRGEFEIPDPSAVSYWSEYLNSAMSKLDHINKTQRKFYQKLKFPLHF